MKNICVVNDVKGGNPAGAVSEVRKRMIKYCRQKVETQLFEAD
jgi:hypothetical protein